MTTVNENTKRIVQRWIKEAKSPQGKARIMAAEATKEAKRRCFETHGKEGQMCCVSYPMPEHKKKAYRQHMQRTCQD